MRASLRMSTLYSFRNEPTFRGGDGAPGGRNLRQGARGKDTVIEVPVGTVVRDLATGEVIADLATPGEEVVLARGGEGGGETGASPPRSVKRRASASVD